MRFLAGLVLAFLVILSPALAQEPATDKAAELVRLLNDPDIRRMLEDRNDAAVGPLSGGTGFADWEARTRVRISNAIVAVPAIPSAVASAVVRTRQEAIADGRAPLIAVMALFVITGVVAEALFRRSMKSRASSNGLEAFLPVCMFAAVMTILFFLYPWPLLGRVVMLAFLVAFVVYRLVLTAAGTTIPDRRWRARARLLTAVICTGAALHATGPALAVESAVTDAIAYVFSLVALALALETVWRTAGGSSTRRMAITLAIVAIWSLWCLGLDGLFWLGVYAFVLPPLLRRVGHAVQSRLADGRQDDTRSVLLVRGSRAVVIAVAAAWLAVVWRVDPDSLAHQNPLLTSLLYGLLKSVVVLLLADLVWHLARAAIDRRILASSQSVATGSAMSARDGRLRTLLPILKNVLAVSVIVVTTLVVLAELGVQIAPLIAGAGIFGVALGFGSQTLVKDILGGVFYMLDDAFRVGEYIQAKDYKGTVEGFSLRSVKLRHHRGPVYTVPFGELGAVQNMSRDWVIDKFRITVGYDTDLEKARKITKRIGADLQADAELGAQFIQPLKMKGVEEFGDYGIVLSFAMTTVPGQQTFIRRKAYAMIREAFRAEGIEFAQPTVQVGGDDRDANAAAAALIKAGSRDATHVP